MLKFTRDHEWILIHGDSATVGIAQHAQELLGRRVFRRAAEAQPISRSRRICRRVESVKAAADIYAPIAGEIVEINQEVVDDPSLLNSDPMGKGWFFKMKIADASEIETLMDEAAYQSLIA